LFEGFHQFVGVDALEQVAAGTGFDRLKQFVILGGGTSYT
jgi:hypothetical protein